MGSRNGPLCEESGGPGSLPRGGQRRDTKEGGRACELSPSAVAGRASRETGLEVRGRQRFRDPDMGL